MPDEVELKLVLRPQDADALESAGLMAGTPKKVRQRSIYFDTADHRLLKLGLSLRIRRSGRKRTQTVKAGAAPSAGLFVRPEWERVVADDTPVIDDTTPIRALLDDPGCRIAPVFFVNVERRAWDITEGGAIIELVLDRGEVVAADRRSPICEIELELKSGDTAALFALARGFDAAAPVRLGIQTKAERGYALLAPVVTAFKAEPVLLKHDMTAAQAFQHIIGACLRQFRLNEDLFVAGRAPEALHQTRVALRRLRSAFAIFRGLIDNGVGARLREDLRWLAGELGDARSIDVLLEHAPPGALRDQLETAHQTTYARVGEILQSARVRGLMIDLAQWSMAGAWLAAAGDMPDPSAQALARASLDRLRRKVKKNGRHLAEASDRARHEVRKDAKKLRYAAEFFSALFGHKRGRRRYKHFIAALEGLQDALGGLNDMATAPDVLTRLGILDAPDPVALLFPKDKRKLLNAAGDAH
jgi:inorganic triphosphatase YgiF